MDIMLRLCKSLSESDLAQYTVQLAVLKYSAVKKEAKLQYPSCSILYKVLFVLTCSLTCLCRSRRLRCHRKVHRFQCHHSARLMTFVHHCY
jgi:hypothetical protein